MAFLMPIQTRGQTFTTTSMGTELACFQSDLNTEQMLAVALPGEKWGRDLHTLIASECSKYSISLFTTLLGNFPSGGSAGRSLTCTLPEILLSAHFQSEHTAQLVHASISQEEGGVHDGNK